MIYRRMNARHDRSLGAHRRRGARSDETVRSVPIARSARMSRSATAAGWSRMSTSPATPRSAPRTVIYPFASLGTPPQSVNYRGGADPACGRRRLRHPRARHHQYRHRGRRRRHASRRPLLPDGRRACRSRLQGRQQRHVRQQRDARRPCRVGDHVVFGGGAAVRQFVRIGEGAMIVGLSGARADVIPWGTGCRARSAHLVGLNVIGHAPQRLSPRPTFWRCARAYQALFFGDGRIPRPARSGRRRDRRRSARDRQDDRLHPRRQTAAHHGDQARRGRRGLMSGRPP